MRRGCMSTCVVDVRVLALSLQSRAQPLGCGQRNTRPRREVRLAGMFVRTAVRIVCKASQHSECAVSNTRITDLAFGGVATLNPFRAGALLKARTVRCFRYPWVPAFSLFAFAWVARFAILAYGAIQSC